MTKRQMIEYSLRKLAEFDALPAEEQFRRLIAKGTINEKGEVLLGQKRGSEPDHPATDNSPTATGAGTPPSVTPLGPEMTEKQLLQGARKALAAFDALPPEERARRLIAAGIINEKGEVLMGGVAENGRKPQPPEGGRDDRETMVGTHSPGAR